MSAVAFAAIIFGAVILTCGIPIASVYFAHRAGWFVSHGATPTPPSTDQWSSDNYPETTDPEVGVQSRGSQARTELNQTRSASLALRRAMLDKIAASGPDEDRLRLHLIAGVQVIDAIRKALETAVAHGDMEAAKDLIDDLSARR